MKTTVIFRCMDCPLYKKMGHDPTECSHPDAPKFPGNIVGTNIAVSEKPSWCPLRKKPFTQILKG